MVVFFTRQMLNLIDDRSKDICIIIGFFTLHKANQTLEAHTRINHVHLERLKASVSLSVILHEDNIPYLDNLRMVFID